MARRGYSLKMLRGDKCLGYHKELEIEKIKNEELLKKFFGKNETK